MPYNNEFALSSGSESNIYSIKVPHYLQNKLTVKTFSENAVDMYLINSWTGMGTFPVSYINIGCYFKSNVMCTKPTSSSVLDIWVYFYVFIYGTMLSFLYNKSCKSQNTFETCKYSSSKWQCVGVFCFLFKDKWTWHIIPLLEI